MNKNKLFHLIVIIIISISIIISIISVFKIYKVYQSNQLRIKTEHITKCIPKKEGICENNFHHINGCCQKWTENSQIEDGKITKLKNISIKINSLGFRNKEYSINKPKNTKRIIFVGDSFVFGFGQEINETFPILLENKLNKEKSIFNRNKYEVWNIGVVSWGTNLEYLAIKQKIIDYSPDAIILLFDDSDFYDNRLYAKSAIYKNDELVGFKEQTKDWFIERKRIINGVWENWNQNNTGVNEKLIQLFDEAIIYLKEIKDITDKKGIPFITMYYPYPFMDKKYQEKYITVFEKKLNQNNITNFNLYPYLIDEEMRKTKYDPINLHWNYEGHKYVTEIFYKYIKEELNL